MKEKHYFCNQTTPNIVVYNLLATNKSYIVGEKSVLYNFIY